MTSPTSKNFYRKGDHNVISDDSGQKFKRSQMRKNWKGHLVAEDEYEPKHPQLTIKPRKESIAIKNGTRTQGADGALANPSLNLETDAI